MGGYRAGIGCAYGPTRIAWEIALTSAGRRKGDPCSERVLHSDRGTDVWSCHYSAVCGRRVPSQSWRNAMNALQTFAIYATPFLVLGYLAKRLLQRYAVDLGDVQAQDGSK